MKSLKLIVKLLILLILLVPALAQTTVPIEKEPHHPLKFENKYVRLFDVLVPTGGTTLYHRHIFDGVGIRLSDSTIINEALSGEKAEFAQKRGDVSFTPRPVPLDHRVINTGKNDFRNIFVEVLPAAGAFNVSEAEALAGCPVIIDNARVSICRRILQPGESTSLHTHKRNGVSVSVSDAMLQISMPGKKAIAAKTKSGAYVWQNAGTAHNIKNVGSTFFESIEIQLKERFDITQFAANYAKAWSSRDPESVAGFFSEKGSLKVNDGKPAVGRTAIADVAREFMTSFPDMVVTMDRVIFAQDTAEFHWTLTGTNTGPGGKGMRVQISGYEIWQIGGDGLIAESKGHFDETEYDRQIEYGYKKQP